VKPATADVYRESTFVGRLARTKHGATFEYDDAFLASGAPGIAFRLPRATKRFETAGVNLHTFFAGLLPEGIRLQALVRQVKTSQDDLFSLLVAAGADCVGDVSVAETGTLPEERTPSVDTKRIDSISFAEVLEKSLRTTKEPAIPGVQEKVSAAMISLPLRARAAAYILKLNPPSVPKLVENEHFFMTLARKCGLAAAETRLVFDRDGRSGLLVTRFDRRAGDRLHQEDACQLLDRYPADKYLLSVRELMDAMDVCSAPMIARARLLRLVAYSYVIGNGDLHGKNVSVRVADGLVELTPAYDVLSTVPYGDLRMALKMDGCDANLRRRSFVAMGERFKIPKPATTAMLHEILEATGPALKQLDAIGFDGKTTKKLEQALGRRRDDLR
jgi:serine/threonine-protein kinase HipA